MGRTELKIFTDRAYLPEGRKHVTMLYPFWGKNPEDPRNPDSGRYDRYIAAGGRFFKMTTLEQADVAVFPEPWERVIGDASAVERAEQFVAVARKAQKYTVLFFWSDLDEAIPYDTTMVFRTSLYRSRRRDHEFAMPAWSEDFAAKYLGGQVLLRSKRDRPVVGFCGYVPSPPPPPPNKIRGVLRRCKKFLKNVGRRKKADASIRAAALRALSASPGIDRNFVIRDHFLGAAVLPSGEMDHARMQVVRQEYVQNIVGSDYILCARGGGNFSYRLYETLSCGRIPVFVDTDCVLPFHSEIDWKRYCVWVDEKEVHRIGEKIAEFHAALSDKQFVELQQECRRLWESHLCPEGFFANLHKHF